MSKCTLSKHEKTQLQTAIDKFDTAKSELVDLLQGTADDWENEFSDSSGRWQESDAGQQARDKMDLMQSWLDDLTNVSLPSLDDIT